MSKVNADVHIENANVKEVTAFLKKILNGVYQDDHNFTVMGMHLKVLDVSSENEYAKAFLQDHDVEETNVFYKNFDLSAFNVIIFLTVDFDHPFFDAYPQVADLIGQAVSGEFQTRSFIAFEDGEIPFRVYSKGRILSENIEDYKLFFTNKNWIPGRLGT